MPTSSSGQSNNYNSYSSKRQSSSVGQAAQYIQASPVTRPRPLPAGPGPLDKNGNKLGTSGRIKISGSQAERTPVTADHSRETIKNGPSNFKTDRVSIVPTKTDRSAHRVTSNPVALHFIEGHHSPAHFEASHTHPTKLMQRRGSVSSRDTTPDIDSKLRNVSLHGGPGRPAAVDTSTKAGGRRSPDQGYGTLERCRDMPRARESDAYAAATRYVMGVSVTSKSLVSGALKGTVATNSHDDVGSGSPPLVTSPGSSRMQASSLTSSTSGYTSSASVGYEDGGKVGLQNLGNTCFMNSVLQCMSNTKLLLNYIMHEHNSEHVNRKSSTMKGTLIRAFVSLLEVIWKKDSGEAVAPRDFKSQIQTFAPRFVGYSQQDAQEFLHYLLQGLHEDINRVQQKVRVPPLDERAEAAMSEEQKAEEYWQRYHTIDNSTVVDIFVGQLRSTLTCKSCRYASTTFEPFWDLSVPIPSGKIKNRKVTIDDCLKAFVEEETLDGDERPVCSNCKTRTACTKSFAIQRFPAILILHLKRFSGERYRSKLSAEVDFPIRGLDLTPFGVKNSRKSLYDLYGIVNHTGSVSSGHYTACCRHPFKEKWYEFNDSRVTAASGSSLVSAEAYVLFYELAGR